MHKHNTDSGKGRILAQSTGAPAGRRRRLAWSLAVATCLFGVVAAFGTVQPYPEPPLSQQTTIEAVSLQLVPAQAPLPEFWSEDRLQRGDTVAALLSRLGVNERDVETLRRSPGMPFSLLRPGVIVQARVGGDGDLQSLWFTSGRDQLLTVQRSPEGFRLSEQAIPLTRGLALKSAQIRSSLFAATDAADIPDSVAAQVADIFGGDIDFHRDLRQGDRFSVVYESLSYGGREIRSGRVMAVEFVNQNRAYRAVWYPDAEGKSGGYYTPEGKSLRKAFLRSPLEFSRITSGFGLRLHPIQQRWKRHTGVDYAAATGTKVRATADGVVEFAGQQSGYGNLIELRHPGGYTTWYAHLNGFAKGLRRGMRIAQGDLIGYVGQTGWATGPHLHYEFRVNNQFRNPLAIAFPAAQPLTGERVQGFIEHARPLAAQLDLLRSTNLALLE